MRKRILHRNELEIIRALFFEGRAVTINQISFRTGISWITVKKYLNKLIDRRLVSKFDNYSDKDRSESKLKFELNDELLKILYERKNKENDYEAK